MNLTPVAPDPGEPWPFRVGYPAGPARPISVVHPMQVTRPMDGNESPSQKIVGGDADARRSPDGDGAECRPLVQLGQLVEIFYGPPPGPEALGRFVAVPGVPPPFDRLLDHHEHMTVTVEAFHGQPVDVRVHRTRASGRHYSREITLVGSRSGRVVQYGIVRLNRDALGPAVWEEIRGEQIPLGRVLIEHRVLREVQLQELWEIECGPALARLLEVPPGQRTYGRTALILCDGAPAIELLEIVNCHD